MDQTNQNKNINRSLSQTHNRSNTTIGLLKELTRTEQQQLSNTHGHVSERCKKRGVFKTKKLLKKKNHMRIGINQQMEMRILFQNKTGK